MKRFFYIIGCAALVLILGILISIPFNRWYTTNYVFGQEGAGSWIWFTLGVYWPLLVIIGGLYGNRIYKKRKG